DVGRAPVDVGVGVQVEHVFVGEGGLGEIAARGVHDPLGLGGGARRVEEVEQVFGVHLLGGALGLGPRHQVVVPVVTALGEGDVRLGAPHHHDVLDRRGLGQGLVGVGLQGNG